MHTHTPTYNAGYIESGDAAEMGSARLLLRSIVTAAAASPHADVSRIADLRAELGRLLASIS